MQTYLRGSNAIRQADVFLKVQVSFWITGSPQIWAQQSNKTWCVPQWDQWDLVLTHWTLKNSNFTKKSLTYFPESGVINSRPGLVLPRLQSVPSGEPSRPWLSECIPRAFTVCALPDLWSRALSRNRGRRVTRCQWRRWRAEAQLQCMQMNT